MMMALRPAGDRRTWGRAVLAAVIILGLAGCYPGGPEDTSDFGVVVTIKNPDADYQGMMTYGMEDIVHELSPSNATTVNPKWTPVILDELQSQMAAAGFTRIAEPGLGPNKPDVWLSVGAVQATEWYYTYGWGGYPSYSWGYYYPYYMVPQFYEQGTVLWQLHDLRNIDDPTVEGAAPPLTWLAAIRGVLNYDNEVNEAGIRTGIQQGFAQSPYIVSPAKNQEGQ